MAISKEWEPLIPLLMKDYWSYDEACMVFNGYVWRGAKGRLTDIRTGEEIVDFTTDTHSDLYNEEINDKYLEICGMWDGSEHPHRSGIWKQRDKWNKYYCIHWAIKRKRIINLDWVRWAYEERLLLASEDKKIKKIIYPESEAEKVIADNSKKAEAKDIANTARKAARSSGTPTTNDNLRERDNLLRLIGAMRDILTSKDEEVKLQKKGFSSNNSLIDHILENYEGEGLAKSTLKDRFKKGKDLVDKK